MPRINKCNRQKETEIQFALMTKSHCDFVNMVAENSAFTVSSSSPYCDNSDDGNCDQQDQNGGKQHRN